MYFMTVRICELIAIFAHHQLDYLAKSSSAVAFLCLKQQSFQSVFFVTSTNLG